MLGVHRKTVAAAVNTGRLSPRMHEALGRHLLAEQAADAPTESVAETRRPWEQHLAAALRRQREDLLAASSAQGQQLRDEFAQHTQALEQRLAALESHRPEGGEAARWDSTRRTGSRSSPQSSLQTRCRGKRRYLARRAHSSPRGGRHGRRGPGRQTG